MSASAVLIGRRFVGDALYISFLKGATLCRCEGVKSSRYRRPIQYRQTVQSASNSVKRIERFLGPGVKILGRLDLEIRRR